MAINHHRMFSRPLLSNLATRRLACNGLNGDKQVRVHSIPFIFLDFINFMNFGKKNFVLQHCQVLGGTPQQQFLRF